jgi:two-component system sensor histidine kinase UhpB
MSLRARVVLLVGAVLLVSMAAGLWLAGYEARQAVREEVASAVAGGRQTIASAFEDLPRSDHPDRDLRQLVSTFDGNRHVSALWIDGAGQTRWRSRIEAPQRPAPGWFLRLLSPPVDVSIAAVPPGVGSGGRIVLRPSPALDCAADWAELTGAGSVLSLAMLIALAGVYLAIGQALQPLNDLSRAFRSIGQGDYRQRVRERGPPELKRLERGFNAMAADLTASHGRNRALEAQLLTIQDEERAELARELHDEIGPHLFAVNVDARVIGQGLARNETNGLGERVRAIQASASHMQRLVRDILVRLRPVQATELGLKAALSDLADFWRARNPDVTFAVSVEADESGIPEAAREAIYRSVQEALSNALRHAQPTQIDIKVAQSGGRLMVCVENDGVLPAARRGASGLGLVGMQERAAALGGQVLTESPQGRWILTVSLPIAQRAAIGEAAE